jgi:hypothetical protein
VLAATGSAVGLGNIWKFPYITGVNGGGAFVLVYLLCIACIGIPIMMAEIMLGRRGRQSPINTMKTLAIESGHRPAWQLLGYMGVLAGFLILSDCRLGIGLCLSNRRWHLYRANCRWGQQYFWHLGEYPGDPAWLAHHVYGDDHFRRGSRCAQWS